jgi:hypothetical protein
MHPLRSLPPLPPSAEERKLISSPMSPEERDSGQRWQPKPVLKNAGSLIFHSQFRNSEAWKAIFEIISKVPDMKDFLDKLKKNNKYDCYFIPTIQFFDKDGKINVVDSYDKDGFAVPNSRIDATAHAATRLVENQLEADRISKTDYQDWAYLEKLDIQSTFLNKKQLIAIYIRRTLDPIDILVFKNNKNQLLTKAYGYFFQEDDKSNIDKRKITNYMISLCQTIVHESVAHGLMYLDNTDTNAFTEHRNYHGDYTYGSPTITEMITIDKYKNTKAKKNLDFIEKGVNEFMKNKNL